MHFSHTAPSTIPGFVTAPSLPKPTLAHLSSVNLTAPREPLCQPPCLSGPSKVTPIHIPSQSLMCRRNAEEDRRGLSSAGGKPGLLKWPQKARWCLKDDGEGGGQRLGGSLHGSSWRSWGWGWGTEAQAGEAGVMCTHHS